MRLHQADKCRSHLVQFSVVWEFPMPIYVTLVYIGQIFRFLVFVQPDPAGRMMCFGGVWAALSPDAWQMRKGVCAE